MDENLRRSLSFAGYDLRASRANGAGQKGFGACGLRKNWSGQIPEITRESSVFRNRN
jgi:hypothetical protein